MISETSSKTYNRYAHSDAHFARSRFKGVMSNMKLRMLTSALLILFNADSTAASGPTVEFAEVVRSGEKIYDHINYSECIIIKIEDDFDQDGDTDYLFSSRCPYGEIPSWGNAGGTWQVYFNLGDRYENSHDIFFHPLSIRIYATGRSEEFKVESYHRMGADEGSVSIEVVSLESTRTLSGRNYTDMGNENSEGAIRVKNTFSKKHVPQPKFCILEDVEIGQCSWKNGYYKNS